MDIENRMNIDQSLKKILKSDIIYLCYTESNGLITSYNLIV